MAPDKLRIVRCPHVHQLRDVARGEASGLRSSGLSGKTSSKAPPTKVLRSVFVGCRFASGAAKIVESRPTGCEHQEHSWRRIEYRLEIESCVGAGKGGFHKGSGRERVDPIMGRLNCGCRQFRCNTRELTKAQPPARGAGGCAFDWRRPRVSASRLLSPTTCGSSPKRPGLRPTRFPRDD